MVFLFFTKMVRIETDEISRIIAKTGIAFSLFTLVGIIVLIPGLLLSISERRDELENLSVKFKIESDSIWTKMIQIHQGGIGGDKVKPTFFSLKKRHAWDQGMCRGGFIVANYFI